MPHYRQGENTKMVSVVGEAYYDDACDRLLPAGYGPYTLKTTATLVREPSNTHDRNAVKVLVKGQHVGYLKRDLAKKCAPALDSVRTAITCDAKIVRRPSKRARKRTVNVNIWLPSPSRIMTGG